MSPSAILMGWLPPLPASPPCLGWAGLPLNPTLDSSSPPSSPSSSKPSLLEARTGSKQTGREGRWGDCAPCSPGDRCSAAVHSAPSPLSQAGFSAAGSLPVDDAMIHQSRGHHGETTLLTDCSALGFKTMVYLAADAACPERGLTCKGQVAGWPLLKPSVTQGLVAAFPHCLCPSSLQESSCKKN